MHTGNTCNGECKNTLRLVWVAWGPASWLLFTQSYQQHHNSMLQLKLKAWIIPLTLTLTMKNGAVTLVNILHSMGMHHWITMHVYVHWVW